MAILLAIAACGIAFGQENSDCFACHEDASLTTERRGKAVSLYIDQAIFSKSVHADLSCVTCHSDLEGKEMPHEVPVAPVQCGTCHTSEEDLHKESLHGKAVARGDALAPNCQSCHGSHAIVPVRSRESVVAPVKIPFVCGRCHQEGTRVQREREIPQSRILENYSESIHAEGLLKKGLVVSANCASCHTPHLILPHTDPRSSIARANIANTCTACHTQIEEVHRKIIKGELWEKQEHVLPACVDCHQPHKARKVFYDQGMADKDCLRCHERASIRASDDGRSLTVKADPLTHSMHQKVSCSQCHAGVNASRHRPCETIVQKVDCASCHAEVGQQFQRSMHGRLIANNDPNAPTCKECHGTHEVKGRTDPKSPIFAINIPVLCGKCHQEGKKAAVRYTGSEHEIISHYTESIHGKGLLKSGLTVTATCSDCHPAHNVLPMSDPASSVNPQNVPATCGKCHHGIQEQFVTSIHSTMVNKTDKELPVCNDCHTAHTIRRTDIEGFKLDIMTKCGRCHEKIANTYFDTYHGKVSQLGYTKTAKCYDCHGAHDILPISDPRSHLSHDNVVSTCQKCHPGANRRFAGYLTHATHHDPDKYPFLFWTFWGMTGLLIGTFVIGGVHTLLWLPRAMQLRRARQKKLQADNEEPKKQDE
ncbi:MAG TPA: cytochrome c3 family protein [Bacteroidota bacterium]|nr:cytochrome c3 family protein [Bacteroidota bacterium]